MLSPYGCCGTKEGQPTQQCYFHHLINENTPTYFTQKGETTTTMKENTTKVNDVLELLGIEPDTTIPENISTPDELRRFKLAATRHKGQTYVDSESAALFRKSAIETIQYLIQQLNRRDDDVKRLADEYITVNTNLRNAIDEIDLMKANGVEIVAESINGVETGVAVENAELKRNNMELVSKLGMMESELSAAQAELAQFRQWGQEVNVLYNKMESDLEQAKDTITQLNEQLAANSAPGSIKHTIAKAKEEYEKELQAVNSERQHLSQRIAAHEARVTELSNENRDLKAQIESLTLSVESETAAPEGKVEELESELLSLTQEVNELRAANEKYSTYVDQMNAWADEIQQQNETMKKQLEAANATRASGGLPADIFDIPDNGSLTRQQLEELFVWNED